MLEGQWIVGREELRIIMGLMEVIEEGQGKVR